MLKNYSLGFLQWCTSLIPIDYFFPFCFVTVFSAVTTQKQKKCSVRTRLMAHHLIIN